MKAQLMYAVELLKDERPLFAPPQTRGDVGAEYEGTWLSTPSTVLAANRAIRGVIGWLPSEAVRLAVVQEEEGVDPGSVGEGGPSAEATEVTQTRTGDVPPTRRKRHRKPSPAGVERDGTTSTGMDTAAAASGMMHCEGGAGTSPRCGWWPLALLPP